HRGVGRRLRGAGRAATRVLPPEPAEPALGGADPLRPGRQITVTMVFHGLTQDQARRTWSPLFDWVTARPADYTLAPPRVPTLRARDFGNAAVLGPTELIVPDDRPGAPPGYFYWRVDANQVGQVLHAYQST